MNNITLFISKICVLTKEEKTALKYSKERHLTKRSKISHSQIKDRLKKTGKAKNHPSS